MSSQPFLITAKQFAGRPPAHAPSRQGMPKGKASPVPPQFLLKFFRQKICQRGPSPDFKIPKIWEWYACT